jgi:gluconolactonase
MIGTTGPSPTTTLGGATMAGTARIDRLDGIVLAEAGVTALDTRSSWAEGVVYLPGTDSIRWSDLRADRILELDLRTGIGSVVATDVGFTNGRTLDLDGSVIQCSHGRRRVERVVDGAVEAVVATWNGVRFNSPNDVVVAADGTIWFTDPPYGLVLPGEGHGGEREYGDHWVFRHDRATGRTAPVVVDVEEPNGLAFGVGESVLYVADSSQVTRGEAGNHHVRVYDVEGGRCKNGRTFATLDVGVPDGLRVDAAGRVWVTAGDGVHVFGPDGGLLGSVLLPDAAANLCFGGPDGTDVFIAATTTVHRIRTRTTDAARRS